MSYIYLREPRTIIYFHINKWIISAVLDIHDELFRNCVDFTGLFRCEQLPHLLLGQQPDHPCVGPRSARLVPAPD